MNERRPHGIFRVLGPIILATSSIGANTIIDAPAYARTNTLSSRSSATETNISNSTEKVILLNISPEMQETAGHAFTEAYEELKSHYTLDAGDGALRLQYGQNPESSEAAIEYQTLGELMALYVGDFEYAERLMEFDDRYKQPNGLTPWKIGRNGKPADYGTVVSDVMIRLATARLMSPDAERQAEGQEILQSMKDNKLVDPKTHLFRAFDWDDQPNLANPAYPNPLFIEQFAKIDPEYAEVAEATRDWMGKIDALIESGEVAYFPSWVDLKGRVTDNEGEEAKITYYAPYVALNQAVGALYCEDPIARADAAKQLSLANDFFYGKIVKTDENGNIEYDSDRLKDGYLLNGKVDRSEDRYADTAFTSAAALASITSEDPAYREYMFDVLLNIPHPTYEPFNDYIRTFALLTLSGKIGQPILENQPTPTPEATQEPTFTPEPTRVSEVFEGIVGPGQEVNEGSSDKNEIFFTIDDGWTPSEMIEILDIAKKYGAKLTLFPVGQQIEDNPEIYQRAYREGHSIQNHSLTHFDGFDDLSQMTDKQIEDEIAGQREIVKRVLGVDQQVFVRIPYGWGMNVFGEQLTNRVSKIAKKMGLAIAGWSAISSGWEDGIQNTVRELRGEIRKGAIITLHDEPEDIKALEAFIKKSLKQGIQPVTMDRLFKDK